MKRYKKVLLANLLTICITTMFYTCLYTGLGYSEGLEHGFGAGLLMGSYVIAIEWLVAILIWIGQSFRKWLAE